MKIKVTAQLKAFAVEKLGVAKDAAAPVVAKAVVLALVKGTVTAAVVAKLTGMPVQMPKKEPAKKDGDPVRKPAPRPPVRKSPGNGRQVPQRPNPVSPQAIERQIQKGVADALARAEKARREKEDKEVGSPTPETVYKQAVKARVKSAAERYESTTKAATFPNRSGRNGDGAPHPFAGQDAYWGGKKLYHPSDLDRAIAGAFLKWSIECDLKRKGDVAPSALRMTDHDRDLFKYALHEKEWSGMFGGDDADTGASKVSRQKLTDFHIKALLDDTVSGGIEAAPVVFDDAIILIPVLYGELYPFINVVNIARGRRVKGATMANPSFTSGISEGTSIQPFNTASFVGAFDTPIYTATSAIEIGLDFEEDSPVDLGAAATEKYGEKALEWLDRVVAVGDGVTEPTGIFTSTGTTAVTSDNSTGGPVTVSDYEGLMFGVEKQFRAEPGAVLAYVSNDTMYRRSRAIQVGPGDERRVFGMTHGDYMLLDKPYKVQNNIPNGRVAFVNLKRYRMYRRLGLSVRVETAGRHLALNNTKLLVLRMRYGGQLELGGAAAVMTDAHV